MKAWAILAIVTTLAGGFWTYTDFIASHAAELQASVDREANLKASNESYIEALAWMEKDLKLKQRQLADAALEYRKIDRAVSALETQLEKTSEDYQICSAMAVPNVVLDSVLSVLSETGSARTIDQDSTSVPSGSAIPADLSPVVARNDQPGITAGVD